MESISNASNVGDSSQQMLTKIETIQKMLVVDKFLQIMDSNLCNKLYAMKDLGIKQSDGFYQEAEAFFKECFDMALHDYFRKIKFD